METRGSYLMAVACVNPELEQLQLNSSWLIFLYTNLHNIHSRFIFQEVRSWRLVLFKKFLWHAKLVLLLKFLEKTSNIFKTTTNQSKLAERVLMLTRCPNVRYAISAPMSSPMEMRAMPMTAIACLDDKSFSFSSLSSFFSSFLSSFRSLRSCFFSSWIKYTIYNHDFIFFKGNFLVKY